MDYIYRALGCSLSTIKLHEEGNTAESANNPEAIDNTIANIIMQYVYNTASKDIDIEAIYRIKIDAEKVRAV